MRPRVRRHPPDAEIPSPQRTETACARRSGPAQPRPIARGGGVHVKLQSDARAGDARPDTRCEAWGEQIYRAMLCACRDVKDGGREPGSPFYPIASQRTHPGAHTSLPRHTKHRNVPALVRTYAGRAEHPVVCDAGDRLSQGWQGAGSELVPKLLADVPQLPIEPILIGRGADTRRAHGTLRGGLSLSILC